ncbi:hypothetical protein Q9189_006866 [Teloschistes chrysophthalmus]
MPTYDSTMGYDASSWQASNPGKPLPAPMDSYPAGGHLFEEQDHTIPQTQRSQPKLPVFKQPTVTRKDSESEDIDDISSDEAAADQGPGSDSDTSQDHEESLPNHDDFNKGVAEQQSTKNQVEDPPSQTANTELNVSDVDNGPSSGEDLVEEYLAAMPTQENLQRAGRILDEGDKLQRPKLVQRKPSGTIVIPRDTPTQGPKVIYPPDDARAPSLTDAKIEEII